ncbi:hypothetical protein SAMN05444008_109200 [Cnuella takakiae]|uniref:Uncharacterized protein n=1 Tax=Cnuella takakiae TaxID=1302690 RepID=A0A1M5CSS7_9BACT|nr:hypothetical protein [Cnuella takakiae]OLY91929.1 hypothetical protein BUE76_08500 [Cnuella takakiae]SHF57781.1 hypothetical protein SAMN05444008_109200 [Cnuella takakiae]
MAKATHRVTGLNNVSETWDRNEQRKSEENAAENDMENTEIPAASELDRVVRDEAAEYDNDNKEDRLLGGDRATRNDDEISTES